VIVKVPLMELSGKISNYHREALNFFASRLLSAQMSRNVSVKVKFKKHMDNLGMCYVSDYNLSGKPRDFILEIRKNQDEEEMLNTFAHEMVHVSQYCYGRMNEEMTRWCGRDFDKSSVNYSEYPWEIEAYSIGKKLTTEFLLISDVNFKFTKHFVSLFQKLGPRNTYV